MEEFNEENKKKGNKVLKIFMLLVVIVVCVQGCNMYAKFYAEKKIEKYTIEKEKLYISKNVKYYLKNKYGEEFETEEYNHKNFYANSGGVSFGKILKTGFSIKAFLKKDNNVKFIVEGKIINPLKENEDYVVTRDEYMNVLWNKKLQILFDMNLKKITNNGEYLMNINFNIYDDNILNMLGNEKTKFEDILKDYPERMDIASNIFIFKDKEEQKNEELIFNEIFNIIKFIRNNRFKELSIWIFYFDRSISDKTIDKLVSRNDCLYKFHIDNKIYEEKIENISDVKKYIIQGEK